MANPHRGEVALHAGDQTYTLRLSVNAVIEIENHFDLGINQVSEKLSNPASMRLGNLRAIVFYALKEHHPNMTESGAGEVIGRAGFDAVGEAIQEAMRLAFPEATDDGRPPKPERGGTGKAS